MNQLHKDHGHLSYISSVKFSPDGKLLVTGSWDGMAKLWDVATGDLLHTFAWGSEGITSIAWSADGRILALGAPSGPSRPPTPAECQRIHAHFIDRTIGSIDDLDLSPEVPTQVRLIDVATGTVTSTICLSGYSRPCVALHPNGQFIAIASHDRIEMYDLASQAIVAKFDDEDLHAPALIFSNDGEQLAAVTSYGVHVFDAETLELELIATDRYVFSHGNDHDFGDVEIKRVDCPKFVPPTDYLVSRHARDFWLQTLPQFCALANEDMGEGRHIIFSPTGTMSAFNTHSCLSLYFHGLQGVRLVEDSSLVQAVIPSPNEKWIRSISFSPDGRLIAGAGDDRKIFVWDVESLDLVQEIGDPPLEVGALDVDETSGLTIVGTEDGSVWLIDVDDAAILERVRSSTEAISFVQFLSHGQSAICVDKRGAARLLSIPSLETQLTWRCREGFVGGSVNSADERFVSVGSEQVRHHRRNRTPLCFVDEWCLETGERLSTAELGNESAVVSVCNSRSQRLISVSAYKELWVVGTDDMSIRPIAVEVPEHWAILRSDFLLDESRVLVGYQGYPVSIVDLQTGEAAQKMTAMRDDPSSTVISQDGQFIVRSTHYSEDIEIFNIDGELQRLLKGHANHVNCVAICRDRLVSGGSDGIVNFWNLTTGELLDSIVLLAQREGVSEKPRQPSH